MSDVIEAKTPRQIVREMGCDYGSEADLAKAILERCETDDDFRVAVIGWAARELSRLHRHEYNRSIYGSYKTVPISDRQVSAQVASKPDLTGLEARAIRNADNLYNYVLTTGILLGDATTDDLEDQASSHETLATSNAIKGRWFRAIQKAMGGNQKKTVRNIVTLEQLAQFREEARHA